MTFKGSIGTDARTFYTKVGGSDTEDGLSLETAKATIQGSIDEINLLAPPPTSVNPAAIIVSGAGIFSENVSIPEAVSFQMISSQSRIFSGTGYSVGGFATYEFQTITTFSPDCVAIEIADADTVLITAAAIFVGGTNARGILLNGTSDEIVIRVGLIEVDDTGAVGIDHQNDNGTPELFDVSAIALRTSGCTGIIYNPTDPDARGAISCNQIDKIEAVSNTIGVQIMGGTFIARFGEIMADLAIDLQAGTLLIDCNSVVGNITVASGATMICDISEFIGDVTNNGTIQGKIGDVDYSTSEHRSSDLFMAARYPVINKRYRDPTPVSVGFPVVINAEPENDTVTDGPFTAGVAAVSNPTAVTDGSATFSADDIVNIEDTSNAVNDGFYEVLSHVGTLLTVKGVGLTPKVEDFTKDNFVTDPNDSAILTKVNVSLMRAGSDGIWETGQGSKTPIVYTDVGSGDDARSIESFTVNSTQTLVLTARRNYLQYTSSPAYTITIDDTSSLEGDIIWVTGSNNVNATGQEITYNEAGGGGPTTETVAFQSKRLFTYNGVDGWIFQDYAPVNASNVFYGPPATNFTIGANTTITQSDMRSFNWNYFDVSASDIFITLEDEIFAGTVLKFILRDGVSNVSFFFTGGSVIPLQAGESLTFMSDGSANWQTSRTKDSATYNRTVISITSNITPSNDINIIQLDGGSTITVTLIETDLNLGKEVYIIGAPTGSGVKTIDYDDTAGTPQSQIIETNTSWLFVRVGAGFSPQQLSFRPNDPVIQNIGVGQTFDPSTLATNLPRLVITANDINLTLDQPAADNVQDLLVLLGQGTDRGNVIYDINGSETETVRLDQEGQSSVRFQSDGSTFWQKCADAQEKTRATGIAPGSTTETNFGKNHIDYIFTGTLPTDVYTFNFQDNEIADGDAFFFFPPATYDTITINYNWNGVTYGSSHDLLSNQVLVIRGTENRGQTVTILGSQYQDNPVDASEIVADDSRSFLRAEDNALLYGDSTDSDDLGTQVIIDGSMSLMGRNFLGAVTSTTSNQFGGPNRSLMRIRQNVPQMRLFNGIEVTEEYNGAVNLVGTPVDANWFVSPTVLTSTSNHILSIQFYPSSALNDFYVEVRQLDPTVVNRYFVPANSTAVDVLVTVNYTTANASNIDQVSDSLNVSIRSLDGTLLQVRPGVTDPAEGYLAIEYSNHEVENSSWQWEWNDNGDYTLSGVHGDVLLPTGGVQASGETVLNGHAVTNESLDINQADINVGVVSDRLAFNGTNLDYTISADPAVNNDLAINLNRGTLAVFNANGGVDAATNLVASDAVINLDNVAFTTNTRVTQVAIQTNASMYALYSSTSADNVVAKVALFRAAAEIQTGTVALGTIAASSTVFIDTENFNFSILDGDDLQITLTGDVTSPAGVVVKVTLEVAAGLTNGALIWSDVTYRVPTIDQDVLNVQMNDGETDGIVTVRNIYKTGTQVRNRIAPLPVQLADSGFVNGEVYETVDEYTGDPQYIQHFSGSITLGGPTDTFDVAVPNEGVGAFNIIGDDGVGAFVTGGIFDFTEAVPADQQGTFVPFGALMDDNTFVDFPRLRADGTWEFHFSGNISGGTTISYVVKAVYGKIFQGSVPTN